MLRKLIQYVGAEYIYIYICSLCLNRMVREIEQVVEMWLKNKRPT